MLLLRPLPCPRAALLHPPHTDQILSAAAAADGRQAYTVKGRRTGVTLDGTGMVSQPPSYLATILNLCF